MKTKISLFLYLLPVGTIILAPVVALGLYLPHFRATHQNTRETAKSCQISPVLPFNIPCDTPQKTKTILSDLIACESQGKETAINAVDRDGTPSYGLLQFKPSTLLWAVREYDLMPDLEDGEVMNVILSGDLQVRAFLAMYGGGKPKEWWAQQFPACSRKHNYWRE